MQILLDNITKIYKTKGSSTKALEDISLKIDTGEFFFLLGPSGCGKTTLLRTVAGLVEPTAGKIYFNDNDVTHLSVNKRHTAMVFQGYALWPHMTVMENVEFGLKMKRVGKKERKKIAANQLDRVQMSGFQKRKPNQLSGGQQQRVALARALASGAECLLFDEPLSNLDANLRLHMRDELKRLVKQSGITAIYVTHDQKEALSMADRIAVMNSGRLVQTGTPEELYSRPVSKFVAGFLGEANFIEGRLISDTSPVKIETHAGIITASNSGKFKTGMNLTCCVRPEHITVVTGKNYKTDQDETILPATIISEIFLGEMRQYICGLNGKEELRWKVFCLTDMSRNISKSEKIFLRIQAKDVILLGND